MMYLIEFVKGEFCVRLITMFRHYSNQIQTNQIKNRYYYLSIININSLVDCELTKNELEIFIVFVCTNAHDKIYSTSNAHFRRYNR